MLQCQKMGNREEAKRTAPKPYKMASNRWQEPRLDFWCGWTLSWVDFYKDLKISEVILQVAKQHSVLKMLSLQGWLFAAWDVFFLIKCAHARGWIFTGRGDSTRQPSTVLTFSRNTNFLRSPRNLHCICICLSHFTCSCLLQSLSPSPLHHTIVFYGSELISLSEVWVDLCVCVQDTVYTWRNF